MTRTGWNDRTNAMRNGSGKGSKLPMLAIAGLVAAAWSNRDKIMAQIEKFRAQGSGSGDSSSFGGAHRADGSDDSASFAAGIADEGTIPNAAVTGSGITAPATSGDRRLSGRDLRALIIKNPA